MSIAALILAIVSIIFSWIPIWNWVGLALGVVALILSAVDKRKRGLRTAALVLAIIGVALCFLMGVACYGCLAIAAS